MKINGKYLAWAMIWFAILFRLIYRIKLDAFFDISDGIILLILGWIVICLIFYGVGRKLIKNMEKAFK